MILYIVLIVVIGLLGTLSYHLIKRNTYLNNENQSLKIKINLDRDAIQSQQQKIEVKKAQSQKVKTHLANNEVDKAVKEMIDNEKNSRNN